MYWRKYLAAWFTDWTGRMSGFASLLLTFWATFFPPNIQQARWGLIVAAIICFILGSYHIWAKEHKALFEEFEKKQLPDLRASFTQVAVGHWNNTNPSTGATTIRGSIVTVFVVMSNRGTPSAVSGWGLRVDFPVGRSLAGVPLIFEGVLPWGMADGSTGELRSVDRLDTKLAEAPIPQGGQAPGFLIYAFDGHQRDIIDQPGNKIRLAYRDVTGRPPRTIEHTLGKGTLLSSGQSLYLPGVVVRAREAEKTIKEAKGKRAKGRHAR